MWQAFDVPFASLRGRVRSLCSRSEDAQVDQPGCGIELRVEHLDAETVAVVAVRDCLHYCVADNGLSRIGQQADNVEYCS